MRTWSVTSKDVRSYRLAADARQCSPDYVNDQIWEFAIGGGDPPALTLWTSYGLRARSMRIFPGFALDEHYVADPEAFATPPEVCAIYPNYLRLRFQPFPDIQVGPSSGYRIHTALPAGIWCTALAPRATLSALCYTAFFAQAITPR